MYHRRAPRWPAPSAENRGNMQPRPATACGWPADTSNSAYRHATSHSLKPRLMLRSIMICNTSSILQAPESTPWSLPGSVSARLPSAHPVNGGAKRPRFVAFAPRRNVRTRRRMRGDCQTAVRSDLRSASVRRDPHAARSLRRTGRSPMGRYKRPSPTHCSAEAFRERAGHRVASRPRPACCGPNY